MGIRVKWPHSQCCKSGVYKQSPEYKYSFTPTKYTIYVRIIKYSITFYYSYINSAFGWCKTVFIFKNARWNYNKVIVMYLTSGVSSFRCTFSLMMVVCMPPKHVGVKSPFKDFLLYTKCVCYCRYFLVNNSIKCTVWTTQWNLLYMVTLQKLTN